MTGSGLMTIGEPSGRGGTAGQGAAPAPWD
jgi:hypothetical protein